jgi:hypothetical protein
MNRILCRECFRRLYPKGHEEKSCSHGCCAGATCVECGKIKRDDKQPYWHCLGQLSKGEWMAKTLEKLGLNEDE